MPEEEKQIDLLTVTASRNGLSYGSSLKYSRDIPLQEKIRALQMVDHAVVQELSRLALGEKP